MTLRVFRNHQLLAEWPQETEYVTGQRLLVLDPESPEPVVYEDGEWDAAGQDILCGYVEPDPSCWRCRPPVAVARGPAGGA